MPTNDFLPFGTVSGANVIDQPDYAGLPARNTGFTQGIARSAEINKAIRQGTSIASAVAQFIADNTGNDVLDNGDVSAIVTLLNSAVGNISGAHIAVASGTADAITATFSPALTALTNGLVVYVRAANANASISPTFNPDSLGALPIVKGANLPLKDGDIGGSGYWMILQYDQEFNKWVLQNPAKGISPLSGIPVGTIEYFATSTPPAGYLKADGAAVGRETYPDLFATIGTTFGEGDGETTFNLPDLIDRFAQGSNTPGQKLEAGLPNITGTFGADTIVLDKGVSGAFTRKLVQYYNLSEAESGNAIYDFSMNASLSNPIYGNSDTVQPPALTLLPCIKAFDAATNPGLIDITELANDVANLSANKLDKTMDGTSVKYVTETFNDGANWYRKWSDGWVEQGGRGTTGSTKTFYLPFSDTSYLFIPAFKLDSTGNAWGITIRSGSFTTTSVYIASGDAGSRSTTSNQNYNWYACGQGAQS